MIKSIVRRATPTYIRDYLNRTQVRLTRLEDLERKLLAYQGAITVLEATLDTMLNSPDYVAGDSVGFNGQVGRKAIFTELLDKFDFTAIVETGTWTGDTTGYLAQTSRLPIYSAELSPRFHALAHRRLTAFPRITLRNEDSRSFLRELATDPLITVSTTFFYLDAHWYADLPLAEEISIIADAWKDFVVLIDDFQVPGDDGYGFDDYGGKEALTPSYIASSLEKHALSSWHPTLPSSKETGAKRGCVVITRTGASSDRLESAITLARAG